MKNIIVAIIVAICTIGYINGIVKLFKCDFEPSYKAEVFYIIGVPTGLNIIFGYIDFGK